MPKHKKYLYQVEQNLMPLLQHTSEMHSIVRTSVSENLGIYMYVHGVVQGKIIRDDTAYDTT